MALAAILAGVAASVLVVTGLAWGLRTAVDPPSSAQPIANKGTVVESMSIVTGSGKRADWPVYTDSSFTVHKGQTVVLQITSYDDGTAPLAGVQSMFDSVRGTVSDRETVDGKAVRSVPNTDVSHTFTVVSLGVNVPIPAAPTGGAVLVVARFVARQSGTFLWQCYAPCGSGTNGMGGAMSVQGWMEGHIHVVGA